MSAYLSEKLRKVQKDFNCIKEIRGLGLMIGVELTFEGKSVVEACFNRGLIINCTHETVLRIMPALNVTKRQIDKAVFILTESLSEVINKK